METLARKSLSNLKVVEGLAVFRGIFGPSTVFNRFLLPELEPDLFGRSTDWLDEATNQAFERLFTHDERFRATVERIWKRRRIEPGWLAPLVAEYRRAVEGWTKTQRKWLEHAKQDPKATDPLQGGVECYLATRGRIGIDAAERELDSCAGKLQRAMLERFPEVELQRILRQFQLVDNDLWRDAVEAFIHGIPLERGLNDRYAPPYSTVTTVPWGGHWRLCIPITRVIRPQDVRKLFRNGTLARRRAMATELLGRYPGCFEFPESPNGGRALPCLFTRGRGREAVHYIWLPLYCGENDIVGRLLWSQVMLVRARLPGGVAPRRHPAQAVHIEAGTKGQGSKGFVAAVGAWDEKRQRFVSPDAQRKGKQRLKGR